MAIIFLLLYLTYRGADEALLVKLSLPFALGGFGLWLQRRRLRPSSTRH